jgi:hypothetical protein
MRQCRTRSNTTSGVQRKLTRPVTNSMNSTSKKFDLVDQIRPHNLIRTGRTTLPHTTK